MKRYIFLLHDSTGRDIDRHKLIRGKVASKKYTSNIESAIDTLLNPRGKKIMLLYSLVLMT